ncbi:MAG: hypothetical protein RI990_754 [Planctomycetota bacterium]|jgi:hypothetical protein
MRLRPPSIGPAVSLIAAVAASVGCDDDRALWGDAMSPTQMQQSNEGPGPASPIFATTEGDSEDPFVDNPTYPFVDAPWWSNPAYSGG